MRLVLRARTQDDTALLETTLVFGGAILRNAGANQRADERPCGAACAGTGDGPRDRAATTRPRPGMAIAVAAATSAPSAAPNPSLILPPIPAPLAALEPSLNSCRASRRRSGVFACRLTSPPDVVGLVSVTAGQILIRLAGAASGVSYNPVTRFLFDHVELHGRGRPPPPSASF